MPIFSPRQTSRGQAPALVANNTLNADNEGTNRRAAPGSAHAKTDDQTRSEIDHVSHSKRASRWIRKIFSRSAMAQALSSPSTAPQWTRESIASITLQRFIDANGQPFVTLDSPQVRQLRCANELLLEAVKANALPAGELFLMSPPRSRETLQAGSNLSGEYFSLMRIGEHVRIGNDVNLLGHGFIELHDNVHIGSGVTIDTIGHPNDPELRQTAFTGTVIVEAGAQIGAGTVLVARAGETLVIGKNARIANDSIVLKSVADGAVAGGVPAKIIEGDHVCEMQQKQFRPAGFTRIDTPAQVRKLFGEEADVTLPFFIKGDPSRLKIDGPGKIIINREAMFDLDGDLTIHPPFQMASRACMQVLPGASAELCPGSFLYTACHVVAKESLRIGTDAIVAAGARVDRNVEDGTIVVGQNRVSGHITDKTYAAVPDEWKDRNTLQPKVESFRKYKASMAGMSFEEIKRFVSKATQEIFQYRSLPFAQQSLYLSEEFARLPGHIESTPGT